MWKEFEEHRPLGVRTTGVQQLGDEGRVQFVLVVVHLGQSEHVEVLAAWPPQLAEHLKTGFDGSGERPSGVA